MPLGHRGQARRRRIAMAGAGLAAVSIVGAAPATAGGSTEAAQRQTGGRAAAGTFSGTIAADGVAVHTITAAAGDIVHIMLCAPDGVAIDFVAPGPGTGPLPEARAVQQWRGTVPEAGTYTARVYQPQGGAGRAAYTLAYTMSGDVAPLAR